MEQAEIERLLGGAPRVSLEDIVDHPRLPQARAVYLDRFLTLYGGDPFLVRLLIELSRFSLYNIVVVLEAAQDPARRETWVTVGLVKAMVTKLGWASGRQVDHLIGRLCAVGFFELRPSDQDRRVRTLSVAERTKAHDRDWLAAHYAPLAFLYPDHDYAPVMRRDAQFQTVHRRACVSFFALGARLMMLEPAMMVFFGRAGGFMVIAALLQAAMAAPDYPNAAVPYGEVGDRFGVSRTQVRKLLVEAQEIGLVRLHARGGHRVEILPRLCTSFDRGIAGGMYFHDVVYQAAAKAAAAPPSEIAAQGAWNVA